MAQTEPPRVVDTRDYRTSWRLTFRFDGEKVALARQERLHKVAPATTAERPVAGRNSGAWVDLVGRSGEVLFHRLLHDPLQTRAEHHSPDGRIELHIRAPEPCEFVVVLPDLPGAAQVILYGSPTEHERMLEAAEEVGRYALDRGEPGDERKGEA